jgi:flagellar FliL protein
MRMLSAAVLVCLALAAAGALASAEGGGEGSTNTRGYEYLEFKPGLVVSFGSTGRVGFLKADVSLRVNSEARTAIEEHMPAIRHELIMLLSRQEDAAFAAGEPREALRLTALESVRALLAEAAGIEAGQVQDLLFTTFITRR